MDDEDEYDIELEQTLGAYFADWEALEGWHQANMVKSRDVDSQIIWSMSGFHYVPETAVKFFLINMFEPLSDPH